MANIPLYDCKAGMTLNLQINCSEHWMPIQLRQDGMPIGLHHPRQPNGERLGSARGTGAETLWLLEG